MPDDFSLMISGEPYQTGKLVSRIVACRKLILEYNALGASESALRRELLAQMLGKAGEGCVVVAPFHCDFGTQIHLGEGAFINYSCVFLDEAPIVIGKRSLIGPQVGIYTAQHPLDAEARAEGYGIAAGVTIGDDVWVGGHATILPGVTIGDGAVIGAGSVVAADVPAHAIVAGNPARVLREVGDAEREAARQMRQAYLEAAGE